MTNIELFNFYKELYHKEFEHKNEINNSLSVPLGIASAIIAAFSYLLTSYAYSVNIWNTAAFLLFIGSALFFLALAVVQLARAYTNLSNGYDYEHLPNPSAIHTYKNELSAYHQQNENIDISSSQIEEYLVLKMNECTDTNQRLNYKKEKHAFLCKKHLLYCTILVFLSLFPFTINYCCKCDKAIDIHLVK